MTQGRSGHIEIYSLSSGVRGRVAAWRLRKLGANWRTERRIPDRWGRRWQAEHTGFYAVLGARRAWTRTGAYLRMERAITRAERMGRAS